MKTCCLRFRAHISRFLTQSPSLFDKNEIFQFFASFGRKVKWGATFSAENGWSYGCLYRVYDGSNGLSTTEKKTRKSKFYWQTSTFHLVSNSFDTVILHRLCNKRSLSHLVSDIGTETFDQNSVSWYNDSNKRTYKF